MLHISHVISESRVAKMRHSTLLLLSSVALLVGVILLGRFSSPRQQPLLSDNQLLANTIIPIGGVFPNVRLKLNGDLVASHDLFRGRWTMLVVCSQLMPQFVYYPQ